jgi:hypothetical protein
MNKKVNISINDKAKLCYLKHGEESISGIIGRLVMWGISAEELFQAPKVIIEFHGEDEIVATYYASESKLATLRAIYFNAQQEWIFTYTGRVANDE